MPYRKKREQAEKKAAPKTGFVADLVRQFADPYALFRELVQNAIDAGTQSIDVTIFRGADGVSRSAVTDAGQGMTLDVLQNNLLTLFSSTKEGDESKVGKYGVGFVSVLAIEPEEVVVETWRDGRAHRLRLFNDHTYEIEALPPRPESGTTVALLKTTTVEEHAAHCNASLGALRRWCRHAHVPIRVTTGDFGADAEDAHERIDSPLSLDCAVSIRVEQEESVFVVGTGSPAGADGPKRCRGFAGFYNRGLTLFETQAEVFDQLRHVSFKVESSKLAHTLSRDNVRRDQHFSRVLSQLRKIAATTLRRALTEHLASEARSVADGGNTHRLAAAYDAARSYNPPLEQDEVLFPLTDPVGTTTAMTAKQLDDQSPWRKPLLFSSEADALTRVISQSGYPVVLAATSEIPETLGALFSPIALLSPRTTRDVRSEYVLIAEVDAGELKPADTALCDAVISLLGRTGYELERVVLTRTIGAEHQRVGLLVDLDSARLIPSAEVPRQTTRFGTQRELCLDVDNQAVKVARRKASADLHAVALLLLRMVILEAEGPLSGRDADALLAGYAAELQR